MAHEFLIHAVAGPDGPNLKLAPGGLSQGLGDLLGLAAEGLMDRAPNIPQQFHCQWPAGLFESGGAVQAR